MFLISHSTSQLILSTFIYEAIISLHAYRHIFFPGVLTPELFNFLYLSSSCNHPQLKHIRLQSF